MRDPNLIDEAITALTERVVTLEQEAECLGNDCRSGWASLANRLTAIESEVGRRMPCEGVALTPAAVAALVIDDSPSARTPGDLAIGDSVVIHLPMGGLIAGTVTAFVIDGDRVTVDCGKREGVYTVGAGDVLKGKREWIR